MALAEIRCSAQGDRLAQAVVAVLKD
jgi:hypothetical protein